MDWLPEAKRIPADRAGGTYSRDVPFRLVLHTTEGSSIEGAVGAYKKHGSWPHLTIDARKRIVVQHYRFGIAARALKRPAGTVATNGASAIQAELVGFAKDTPNWSAEDVVWLGKTFAPILDAYDIGRYSPTFLGPEAGTIATRTAPQRMSPAEWLAFNGVCGHQHVPNNDHWDPGRFQIARFLLAAAPPPTPPQRKTRMFIVDPGVGALFLVNGSKVTLITSGEEFLRIAEQTGAPAFEVSREFFDNLLASGTHAS